MDFQQFLIILKARYKVALYILLATVAITLVVSLILPNKYLASTSVVLDVKAPDPIAGLVMGMVSPTYMATQVDIITSERVAQGAAKLLKLDQSSQIGEQWSAATERKEPLIVWLGKFIAKKIEVKPSRDSDVITISFSSEDPAFAATGANAVAQAYINTNLELKVEPARQYAQWFQARVAELRKELENAQARLAQFQKQTGIISSDSRMQNLDNTRIAELSNQLVLTDSQSAEFQSKKKNIGAGDTLTEVMQSPIIVSLKEQVNTQEAKLKQASLNLGKNNPEYQAMESEIAELKQKMAAETQKIMNSINTANSVNKQKGSELKATIESYKSKAIQDSTQRDQIAVLENDVESAQKAYDLVVQRYTESSLQSQANQTNISVLTPATEPTQRSSPKVYLNMVVAVFVGTLLGVGAAFAAEMFDQRVRTSGALGTVTGIPVLIEFTRDAEPFSIKKWLTGAKAWLMKFARAVRMKLRFRRVAAAA